jgi:L-alanine-DL-glutamate epimerase-like enolase superfamily enzyme
MAITRVRAYHLDQPHRRGAYRMNHGGSPLFVSTVLSLETDEGITGWGEVAMVGAFYSEAFTGGARAGIAEVAPLLLGLDSTRPRAVLAVLDRAMRGQLYIKSAIDVACWDAAGKAAGRPLCELLGGRLGDAVALYNVITLGSSEAEAIVLARTLLDEGYRRLQVKVGTDPVVDARRLRAVREAVGADVVLFADGNGGYTSGDARRFLRLTRDLEFTLEEPCRTYAETRSIRADCDRPLVLDESIECLDDLLRAHHDGVIDGITIKVGRVGGVTRSALLRDVACELDVPVTVECIGGGTIATAAFIHLGLGVPDRLRIHTVDYQRWFTADNATGLPDAIDGAQPAPAGPGLGVDPDLAALGEPIFELSA